jgi:hypothetical protein
MSKIDIWNNLTKLTDRLANAFDMNDYSLEDVEQITDLLCRFARSSNGKESILRALNRERSLMIYQRRRKKYSHSRKEYLTPKSKALQKIKKTRQNTLVNRELVYFVFQDTFDFWTEKLSRSSKWRIKKELDQENIRIIQKMSELDDFS